MVRAASEQGRSDIAMLRQPLFSRATQRLRITTPYFAPDAVVLDALVTAARRGVQVQLLVPGGNNDNEVDVALFDAAARAARKPLRALTGLVSRWT